MHHHYHAINLYQLLHIEGEVNNRACAIIYDLLFMVYINLKQQQVVTKKENEEKEICFLPEGIENFRSKMITMYVLYNLT